MKYFRRFYLVCVSLLAASSSFAQYNKVTVGKFPSHMEIYQVDYRESSTMVYMKYVRQEGVDWMNIGEDTFVKIGNTYKKYLLINSINLPISSSAEIHNMLFEHPNQEHHFALEFEQFPKGVQFDIVENEENQNAFNFYGINVDTTQVTEMVNLDNMVRDFPITKENGKFIKDDTMIQYIKSNGLILTIYCQWQKLYGKYYIANIDLQNFSGKSVLLSLNNVKAEGMKYQKKGPAKTFPLEILSQEEYDKKVSRKQSWANFWTALGEGMAAANAGYSTSTTTYNGSSNTSVYANAYGHYGNTYGYASAYGSAYTTSYGKSHTTTYNGAAAYAAQQQARANYQEYVNNQYQIREQLNEGYVKTNTIRDKTEYSGHFNLKYKELDHLRIIFRIGNEDFEFIW